MSAPAVTDSAPADTTNWPLRVPTVTVEPWAVAVKVTFPASMATKPLGLSVVPCRVTDPSSVPPTPRTASRTPGWMMIGPAGDVIDIEPPLAPTVTPPAPLLVIVTCPPLPVPAPVAVMVPVMALAVAPVSMPKVVPLLDVMAIEPPSLLLPAPEPALALKLPAIFTCWLTDDRDRLPPGPRLPPSALRLPVTVRLPAPPTPAWSVMLAPMPVAPAVGPAVRWPGSTVRLPPASTVTEPLDPAAVRADCPVAEMVICPRVGLTGTAAVPI